MGEDPLVLLRSRPGDARRPRRRTALAAAVVPLAGLLGLTSCGTIPPGPTSPGSSLSQPASTSASPSTSPRPFPTGPATSSPRVTQGPTVPAATPTRTPRPSRPSSTPSSTSTTAPPADTWVGTFRGHRIQVPRGHGATMSFTFDDGPWPGSTAQVLALLQQHHVHAVFCLIGNQAQAYPTLVHKEVAGGHELCDHSRDHDLTMGRRRQAYVDAEVGDGLRQIQRAAPRGTRIGFYRQPGGTWDAKVVRAMDAHDLDPLRWSDDPRDWSRPGSVTIVRRVVSNLHPGVVVLMHDGGGDRSQSVEALRFLLGAVVAAGWKPVLAPHVKLSPKAAAKPQ